jgi:hypothetical protein
MIEITSIFNIDNKKHIALLDTSSISFMQRLKEAYRRMKLIYCRRK